MYTIYKIPFLPPFPQVENFGLELLMHMKLNLAVNGGTYYGNEDMCAGYSEYPISFGI